MLKLSFILSAKSQAYLLKLITRKVKSLKSFLTKQHDSFSQFLVLMSKLQVPNSKSNLILDSTYGFGKNS